MDLMERYRDLKSKRGTQSSVTQSASGSKQNETVGDFWSRYETLKQQRGMASVSQTDQMTEDARAMEAERQRLLGYDIASAESRRQEVVKERDTSYNRMNQAASFGSIGTTTLGDADLGRKRARKQDVLNTARSNYERLDAEEKQLTQDIEAARKVQTRSQYDALTGNADFAALSAYNPNNRDALYRYINNVDRDKMGGIAQDGAAVNYDPHRKYQLMSDEDRMLYNYLTYTQGTRKANEFLAFLDNDLRKAQFENDQKANQEFGNEHKVFGSVLSVPTNLIGGVMGTADIIGRQIAGVEQDPYSDVQSLAVMGQNLRQGASQDMDSVGKFLYNAGMSVLDSLSASRLPGKFAPAAVLSSTAFASTAQDIVDRGGSDQQAIVGAAAAAAFEWIFESVSIGNFKSMQEVPVTGVRDFVWNLFKSGGVNASEEMTTELANIVWDTATMGDISQWKIAEQGYTDGGYTPKEAKNKVIGDMVLRVLEAGASGFLSGLGFGTVGSIQSAVQNNTRQVTKQGKQVIKDGGYDALLDEALKLDFDTPAYQMALQMRDGTMEANDLNIGRLAAAVERQSAKNTVSGAETAERSERDTYTVINKLKENIPDLSGMETVAQTSANVVTTVSGNTMAEKARKLFEAVKGIVTRPNFGDVEINGRSVKDDLSHGVGPAKAATIAAVPAVIRDGKQIYFKENWKGRGYDGYVFAAPVDMDGKTVYVAAVVTQASKNRFYLHEVVDSEGNIIKIDDGESATPTSLATNGDAGAQTPSPITDITIPRPADSVNSGAAVSDQQAAKNMAQVREYATIFGEHGSKALSAAYDETTAKLVSAQDAQAGFFAAYTAARDGKALSAEEQHSVAKLTPGLRFAAETAGKADALRAEQAVYFGEDAELVKDDMLKKANLRSKERRMLDAIAKNAGIKVRMVDKLVDDRGYAADAQYKDGELLISLKAADPVRAAFTHDLVHRIRVVSPEAYTTLASFVRDNMGRDNWNALVKGEASRYGEKGMDYLSEEMVADAFGKLMGDSALLDQFVKEDRNAWQIVLDAIRDMIAAIKRALNGQNVTLTAEQKADFAELQANLEGMSKALEKALKQMEADVQRNTKEGNKNTASEGGEVKYLIAQTAEGLRYVQADRQIILGDDSKKWATQIENFINEQIRQGEDVLFPTEDGHMLVLTARSAYKLSDPHKSQISKKARELLSDEKFALKGKVAAHIDELIQVGRFKGYEPDVDGLHENDIGEDGFNYFTAFFKDGGKDGAYYRIVFSSALNGEKETGYSIGDVQKRRFPSRNGSSGKTGALNGPRKPSNDRIIYQSDSASQEKSSMAIAFEKAMEKKKNMEQTESKNSLTMSSDPSTTELIQENTRLKEQVERWKGQTKRTTTPTLRQGDVDKLTRQIVKDYDGTLDWHDIAGDVKALGEFILQGGEELTWSEVKERAMDIGRRIVNSAQVLVDGELEQDLNGLKGYLRNTTLAYEDNGDIPDFNDWRKRHFGKFTISKDGLPVDVAYQELQGAFGEVYFPADITHPSDQLMHIAQLLDDMQSVMENPYSADMEQAIQHAANALIDGLLSEQVRQTPPTFADKQAAKLDRVKAKSRESTKRQLDRVRADRDAKLEQLKEKHRAKDKAGRERQNAGELRRKIGKHVSKLSQKLLKPSDKQHVPESLRGAVAAMLEAINLEGPYTIDPDTGKRVKNGGGEPTKRTAAFEALRKAYQQALTEGGLVIDPDLLGEDGNLAKVIEMRHVRLSDMSTEQLETVWRTIRAVEKSITDANKLLAGEKFAGVLELAQEIKVSAASRKTKGNYGGPVGWINGMTNTEMLDPLTFLHQLGKGGDALYRILQNARDQRTAILKQVTELTGTATEGLDVKGLQRQKHTFTTESGDKITVTTAQLMSLYELNKRQQAQDHIYKGGIRPSAKKSGISKDKTAGENLAAVLGKEDAPAESVHVTQEDVRKMLSALTEEQIKAADALQMIMETYLADEGNKASMAVYGYKKFTEKNYFPISSDPHQVQSKIGDMIDGEKRPRSIAEWGSAKGAVEHANNGLVLGDIFDVVAQHAVDMATYASHLAAMEDVNRVRNFQFRDKEGNRTGAMGDIVDRVMGRNGNAYLDKLLQDVSAGTAKGGGVSFAKLTANYKAASVGMNVRVALQQPTSYLRAAAVIDPKYLMQAIGKTGGWEKALRYAPIAQWKEWGNFEINQGRQLQDIMFGTDSKLDKARENSMWLAAKMDSITWGAIWNACELELAQTQPELRKGSEEFYQAVADRFTDVVDQTQVVDNVLGRSQIMRNTDTMQKMATSYLGEPTKQYNMLYRAFTDWNREQDNAKRSKALKALGVTITSYVAANFMNAVAQSLWDAVRDDDDREEKYWERFMSHVLPNFFDNINPLGGIPYVKDVVSTLQGYEVKRMDMQAITGLVSALQGVEKALRGEGRYTVVGSMANLLAEFGRIVGLPVATVKRDLMAIARNFAVEVGDWQFQYYIERTFNSLGSTYNRREFYDILFGALQDGDLDAYNKISQDMVNRGVKSTAIENAMRSRHKDAGTADRSTSKR